MVLSGRANNWLRALHLKVVRDGSRRESTTKTTVQEILRWCAAETLIAGNWQNLPDFTFTPKLLQDIAAAQRAKQQHCFKDELQSSSRTGQAESSAQENKNLGERPRQYRVLIWQNIPPAIALLQPLSNHVLDIDLRLIDLSGYNTLLVAENLDCFYAFADYRLKMPQVDSLVIYKGDSHYGSGGKLLLKQWLASGKPALYFGDFDAKGLSIALTEGYTAILLPELVQLKTKAHRQMQPDEQQGYFNNLTASPLSPIASYIKYLHDTHQGLRQQKMVSMALNPVRLYPSG